MKKTGTILCMKWQKGAVLVLASLLLSACTKEEMQALLKQAQNAPAQVAVDTISKLVTADSLFRDDQYQFATEDLKKLFLENEYEILVEDHHFFYCYDSAEKEYEGTKTDGNFLVIAVDPYADLITKGTTPFRSQTDALRELPLEEKNELGFERGLAIENGGCFEIETMASRRAGDLAESKKSMWEEKEYSLEEMEKVVKEVSELPEEEKEVLKQELTEFYQLAKPTRPLPTLSESPKKGPTLLRVRLKR